VGFFGQKYYWGGSPHILECGLNERRTSGKEMEVNTMEEREINDIAGEEVVIEDMDYAKVKNKVIKPKERVGGETGPELSSGEELRALLSTVRNRK
jgi:hypothetical protein